SRPPKTPSSIEPYREAVQNLLQQGLELTAIWQRLRDNYGFTGSYSSLRRFVSHAEKKQPETFVRIHTKPAEEMQVDFGSAGKLYDPARGYLRTAYVFVATLSYSRHQYAELVFDQQVPTWIGLHRHAFEYFGGCVMRVVPDNLKAAVLKALVYDPLLGEAYRKLALHYGFLISPTRPATPRHKGKVENGIHYVKRNFIAGQEFADIHFANQHLREWITQVAGVRLHGTTHQMPLKLFHEIEKAQLKPLPDMPFELCEIRPVKVHPDCHVTIAGSYYSVPFNYVKQTLDAYIYERVVEIYHGQELVATHLRSHKAGEWQTHLEHYPQSKAAYLQRTPEICRQNAKRIGDATYQVVERLLADRPLDRLRSVQAILRLAESVGAERLEAANARALYFGDIHYRRIKAILNTAQDREPLPKDPPPVPPRTHTYARSSQEFWLNQSTEEEV
ncbi:MAG: IS21 family transposase, partial [Bacteroidota bacterium]